MTTSSAMVNARMMPDRALVGDELNQAVMRLTSRLE
jgi:hypothetical protein